MYKVIILAVLCLSAIAQIPTIATFKDFKGMNPLECIEDTAQFVQASKVLADQIVTNVQDYASIVNDINAVLTIVEKLLPDCGVNADLKDSLSGFITYSNSSECLADIEQIVGTIAKLSEDLNNKDFNSLITDALAFVNLAQQTIADCKGVARPALLTSSFNATLVNYTWCMQTATLMVAQFELFHTENNTGLDFNHHINHAFNATNATFQMFTATCGMQFINDFISGYAPIDCLSEARNAAISGNVVIQGFQKNPFGVLNDMAKVMTSFNNMKIKCPFMANTTQPNATLVMM